MRGTQRARKEKLSAPRAQRGETIAAVFVPGRTQHLRLFLFNTQTA